MPRSEYAPMAVWWESHSISWAASLPLSLSHVTCYS
jgi:hypothetical protein